MICIKLLVCYHKQRPAYKEQIANVEEELRSQTINAEDYSYAYGEAMYGLAEVYLVQGNLSAAKIVSLLLQNIQYQSRIPYLNMNGMYLIQMTDMPLKVI